MTLPRLAALSKVWARTPPINETAALLLRALGWTPSRAMPSGSIALIDEEFE